MPSTARIGLLLVLIGVAGLLSPLALFAFHDPVHVVTTDPNGLAYLSDFRQDEVVGFGNLSTTEQRAIEPRDSARYPDGFSPDEWRRADGIRTHNYVAYENGYYPIEVSTYTATPRNGYAPFIVLFVPLGVILAVFGVLVAQTESMRPLDPARSLWLVLGAGVGLFAYQRFSGIVYPGNSAEDVFVANGILLAGVSLVVLGSALARNDHWASLGGGALFASFILYNRTVEPASLEGILMVLCLVGFEFLVLGFLLTRPETTSRNVDGTATDNPPT